MADFKKLSFAVIGGTIVIAGGIIGSSALLSRSSFNLKSTTSSATEKTITVKGVAEKEIASDIGAFSVVVSWDAPDRQTGYAETARWREMLDKKFAEIGIKPEFIETQTLDYNAVFKTVTTKEGNKTNSTQVFSHYCFTYNFRIVSSEVKILESAPGKLYELIAKGMNISVSNVEFFISNPEQYGNGNPLQYSYLENSMDRGAWKARVQRAAKS